MMTTAQWGTFLMISSVLCFAFFLFGNWNGKRQARWERQVESALDAASIPQDLELPAPGAYPAAGAADDDDDWLAGIKSRTDAFIALHCTSAVLLPAGPDIRRGASAPSHTCGFGTGPGDETGGGATRPVGKSRYLPRCLLFAFPAQYGS